MRKAFEAVSKGVNQLKIDAGETSMGAKIQVYSMLGESIKDEQEALSIYKKGQSEMR